MPLLGPITPASLAWSPIFLGYQSYLSASTSFLRLKTGVAVGTSDEGVKMEEAKDQDPAQLHKDQKKLLVASRAVGNFQENVPFVYLITALAELNGAPTWLIHSILATLFSLRVAHVELGLKAPHAMGLGRPVGGFGTIILGLSVASYNFSLGYEALKSFIGI
ncbi:hypothetical protein BT69DRAFT_1284171 [Atractiella rhizophila]|nr:hypothetical protein BT69DRAFT_1284827 [Atractiella rhizophila]KAH8920258.1 hypothetical protein BT69DRAFT_1284171 [Atractiella rhizophila]